MVERPVSSSELRLTLCVLNFCSIPVAATVDLMVSRIGPISQLRLLVDGYGPIRGSIKLTV